MDKKKIWQEVLESIKIFVSPAIFSTWFTQTFLSQINESGERTIAEIGCTSSFVKSTLENRYFGITQDSLEKTLGKKCDIFFVVKQDPNKKSGESSPTPLFQNSEQKEDLNYLLEKSKVRVSFTFDNFAVSPTNQMAWAAAEAVAKSPGNAYNPLFIWGGVGVGKTHLMMAVGNYLFSKNPDVKVLFSTGEDFTNGIVEGIRNKTTQEFRNRYRKLNCLLLDDVQFIAGKESIQEEFFHTFNSIVSAGGQVILTSDKHPSEISKLEERLRSRFEAGLIVDISQPDFELRCAITQIKSQQKGLDLHMNIINLIAGNLDSARKIEGFLVRLSSEAKLRSTEITEYLVENILGKGSLENEKKIINISPEKYINAVSNYFSIGKRVLLGSARPKKIALPRQILMYLLRTELSLPLQEIGKLIGNRDHTTVIHAVDKITKLSSDHVQTRQDILGIKSSL